jgi:hypothetical protein
MPINPRTRAVKRTSRHNENILANPAELKEQMRMQKLAQIGTDPSVKGMSNAHYAAQMKNIERRQLNNQSLRDNYGENNNSVDPQVTYASLNHLHGPTKRSTEIDNSRETLYAPISYVVHGPRKQSAFKGKSSKNPTNGGARKKTRKHKKESNSRSKKSRKVRK